MNLGQSSPLDAGRRASAATVRLDVVARLLRLATPYALVAGIAVFMRLYRLELQAWNPDTYEQIAAASRLLHADFPLSRLYPPGVALTLAPAFALFPDTLATTQGVIIIASLSLVAIAYAWSMRIAGDRRAALMSAFAVGVAPQFVYFSRDGMFDIIGTAWLAASVFGAGLLRGRGWRAGIAFGVVLALAINVRATNVFVVPAVLLYALAPTAGDRPAARPGALAAAFATAIALTAAGIAIGGWLSGGSGETAVAAKVLPHLAFYWRSSFGGILYAPLALPLAAFGARSLWRRDRAFVLVAGYLLLVWPLVHAPFHFANTRYMLPVWLLVLMLAIHGASSLLDAAPAGRWRRWLAAPLVTFFVASLFIGGAATVRAWPNIASHSDEAAFAELRPSVAAMPDDALLVGAWLRGVREANSRVTYLDLVDERIDHGNTPERIDAVAASLDAPLRDGRPVYYLYSRAEADQDTLGYGGEGFDAYFAAIASRFQLDVVQQTSLDDFRLYRITAPIQEEQAD